MAWPKEDLQTSTVDGAAAFEYGRAERYGPWDEISDLIDYADDDKRCPYCNSKHVEYNDDFEEYHCLNCGESGQ